MKGSRKYAILVIIIAVLFYSYVKITSTVQVHSTDIEGYTPVRVDSVAQRYVPIVIPGEKFDEPVRLLYRASRDTDGNLHLAYHFIWDKEENNAEGLMPFLSRNLYTGGLSLQRVMFGKGDVEVVGMVISPKNRIMRLEYETAADYDPRDFSVKHKDVTVDGPVSTPVCFEVISWNHMFDYKKSSTKKCKDGVRLQVEYFSKELWEEYTMFKREETMLKKNRAHFKWERESI